MSFLSHRRRLATATGIALVAGLMAAPAVSAVPQAPAAPSAKGLHDDFNGDGYADVAVGAPRAAAGGSSRAGAVSVLYGGPGGLTKDRKQVLTWPERRGLTIPWSAEYGTGLRGADLDGDGYADLISRLQSAVSGDSGRATAVNWGGPSGLSKNATVLKPVPGDQDEDSGDLAVGDVNGDKVPDIVLGDVRKGGHVLYGPVKRSGAWSRVGEFGVDAPGVTHTGAVAVGDVTGDGTGDLVVLSFREDPWLQSTFVLPGGRDGFGAPVEIKNAQDKPVGGTSVGVADLDRDGFGDVVIGKADDYTQADTPDMKGGSVFVSYGGPGGRSTSREPVRINQDTEGVPGTAEYHDWMGFNLSFGDTDGDGYTDVATGVPLEKVTGTTAAGRVIVLKGGPDGVSGAGAKEFGQFTAGVPGKVEQHDRFGEATSLADHNADGKAQLVVGGPAENRRHGALWVFRSNASGVIANGSFSFGAATIGAPKGASHFSEFLTD
ncbi:FG-GAP-like repeat-containing protein [Streptomyces sp. NPDC000594]|uniref:FG-GAP-like repeat-containing protein n=1 Tax=Streptomyces sp. NPDC000594 TaxID=3154261 RepID=UPI0033274D11